jgi:MYXO-CTERM domain-containing protein
MHLMGGPVWGGEPTGGGCKAGLALIAVLGILLMRLMDTPRMS